jgi:hypothetical protein
MLKRELAETAISSIAHGGKTGMIWAEIQKPILDYEQGDSGY